MPARPQLARWDEHRTPELVRAIMRDLGQTWAWSRASPGRGGTT
ncbi:MAG: hypothetical protein ACRDUV_22155 [Pseudonocardiaceae bacterium]